MFKDGLEGSGVFLEEKNHMPCSICNSNALFNDVLLCFQGFDSVSIE